MKLKFSVKMLSVLLAVIVVAAPLAGLTAYARERTIVQNYPLIDIPGFMASDIYEDKNDRSSKEIFPWSTDDILNTVKNCIPALLKFLVNKDHPRGKGLAGALLLQSGRHPRRQFRRVYGVSLPRQYPQEFHAYLPLRLAYRPH